MSPHIASGTRYKGTMTFKTGVIIGLAIGYYYGAKAGRDRYLQIERVLQPVRESDLYVQLADKTRGAVGYSLRETANRAREAAFGNDDPVIHLRRDAS
jgi:hypothetical protein